MIGERECINCETPFQAQSNDPSRLCLACFEEQNVVRKMPVCGLHLHDNKEGDEGHFCILPIGHKRECECIPDGLTT
jgi:hypothetical protein